MKNHENKYLCSTLPCLSKKNKSFDVSLENISLSRNSDMKSVPVIFPCIIEILICVSSSLADDLFDCDKDLQKVEGISAIYCSWKKSGHVTLPVDEIPKNVQHLIITAKGESIWRIDKVNMFPPLPNLVKLDIELERSWEYVKSLEVPTAQINLSTRFFADTKLEELSIKYSKKNEFKYQWILPKSLKTFQLHNSVFDYDLKKCEKLLVLNLTENGLNYMPSLHKRAVTSLTKLNLRDNPLTNFTVNDVAKCCYLTYFAVKNASFGECESNRISKWVEVLKKENKNFVFDGDLRNITSKDCSGYKLDEANRLRQECLEASVENYFNWMLTPPGLYVLIAVATVVIVFCAVFFYVVLVMFL